MYPIKGFTRATNDAAAQRNNEDLMQSVIIAASTHGNAPFLFICGDFNTNIDESVLKFYDRYADVDGEATSWL